VIDRAVVCPHPPLLFRELAGAHDSAAELRAACRAAVATLVSCEAVAVVGGADGSAEWDPAARPDVRRFGTTGPRTRSGLPLSVGVGRRLLEEAGWTGPVTLHTIRWDADRAEVERLAAALTTDDRRTGLLVLGDGSTRRGQTAPGFLDERAFGFDDALAAALGSADLQGLLDLDVSLAEDLMVLGRAAFQVLAAAARTQDGNPQAALVHRSDPFGVSYFVCEWRFPGRR
jgi:hypothetical protein